MAAADERGQRDKTPEGATEPADGDAPQGDVQHERRGQAEDRHADLGRQPGAQASHGRQVLATIFQNFSSLFVPKGLLFIQFEDKRSFSYSRCTIRNREAFGGPHIPIYLYFLRNSHTEAK
jgi:hypothetical protein